MGIFVSVCRDEYVTWYYFEFNSGRFQFSHHYFQFNIHSRLISAVSAAIKAIFDLQAKMQYINKSFRLKHVFPLLSSLFFSTCVAACTIFMNYFLLNIGQQLINLIFFFYCAFIFSGIFKSFRMRFRNKNITANRDEMFIWEKAPY